MATEVVKVIDPDMGTGWDYDSLYDWEAAQQGDLTGVRDEIAIAKCRCTGGTADTTGTQVLISGWTPSATQYIKIVADTGHEASTVWSDSKYRLNTSLSNSEDYTQILKIQVQNDPDTALTGVSNVIASTNNGSVIFGCHVRSRAADDGYNVVCIALTGSGVTQYCINSIANNRTGRDSTGNSGIQINYDTKYIYNCTAIGGKNAIRVITGTTYTKNCYAGNSITADYSGTISKTTCASEDTSGLEGLTEIAYSVSAGAYFTNITSGSENFAIGASSALIGAGTNLYNDATYPFQDDINGNDRGGSGASWDIGADEYVSTGINPNVSDSITLTDVATVGNSTVPLDTSDACAVSEEVIADLSIEVSIFDEIVLAEDIVTDSDSSISIYDELSISEYIDNLVSECVLDTYDLVTVSEYSIVYTEQLGTVVWGHDTGVEESVAKNFQGNWTGTGSIGGSDDEEVLEIETGNYMESENVQLGTGNVVIALNKYRSGTLFPVRKYKTAAVEGDLAGLGWSNYTDQFYCEGWVKIRLEVA